MKLVMKLPLSMFIIKARVGRINYDRPHGPTTRFWTSTAKQQQLFGHKNRLRGEEQALTGQLSIITSGNYKP